MKSKVRDIAKLLGVSPATVSNALNNKKGVSEDKRTLILETARKLGYSKGLLDIQEKQKSIRFIIYKRNGLFLSYTPFYSLLIEGIERACRSHGYEMLITHFNHEEQSGSEIVELLKKDYSSGFLVLATEMHSEDLAPLENLDTPFVILDNYFDQQDFDFVLINNSGAAYKGTRYLLENGHTQIGFLNSTIPVNNLKYRKMGYIEALNEAGIAYNEKLEFKVEPTIEGSYRDMKKILEDHSDMPTAFFVASEPIAFGTMRALQEKGIRIPQDVSIMCFDDSPSCEVSSPRLTSIKVLKQDMGSIAVKRLLDKVNNHCEAIQKIEIGTELVIRDSISKIN